MARGARLALLALLARLALLAPAARAGWPVEMVARASAWPLIKDASRGQFYAPALAIAPDGREIVAWCGVLPREEADGDYQRSAVVYAVSERGPDGNLGQWIVGPNEDPLLVADAPPAGSIATFTEPTIAIVPNSSHVAILFVEFDRYSDRPDPNRIFVMHRDIDQFTRKAIAREPRWQGEEIGVGIPIQPIVKVYDSDFTRFSMNLVATQHELAAMWSANSNFLEGGNVNIGADKDIIFSRAAMPENKSFPSFVQWTEPGGVNPNYRADESNERRPDLVVSADGNMAVASWVSVPNIGISTIHAVTLHRKPGQAFLCDWASYGGVNLVNDESKHSNSFAAVNSNNDWIIVWIRKDYALMYALAPQGRWTPNSPRVLTPIAYPHTQRDNHFGIAADPSNPSRWVVAWPQFGPRDGTPKFGSVVVVTTTDGGETWSRPFHLNKEDPGIGYHVKLVSGFTSDTENATAKFVFAWTLFEADGTAPGDVKVARIAADELFDPTTPRDYVNDEPAPPPPLPVCLDITLSPGIEVALNPQQVSLYDNDLNECLTFVAPPGYLVELDFTLLVSLEGQFAPTCPFDYVVISDAVDQTAAKPIGPALRYCAKSSGNTTMLSGTRFAVIQVVTDETETGGNRGAKVFDVVARAVLPAGVAAPDQLHDRATELAALPERTVTVSTWDELYLIFQDHESPLFRGEEALRIEITADRIYPTEQIQVLGRTNVTIVGTSSQPVAWVGTGSHRLFFVGPTATFSAINIRFENGIARDYDPTQGGAIFNLGTIPLLKNCEFVLNQSQRGLRKSSGNVIGGAIMNRNFIGEIRGCLFESNRAYMGGAIAVSRRGHIDQIVDSSFFRNFQDALSATGGGAIFVDGSIDLIASARFVENTARGHGGAILVLEGSLTTIQNTTFESNIGTVDGGAVAMWSLVGSHAQFDTIYRQNSAHRGGTLMLNQVVGPVEIQRGHFEGGADFVCSGGVCVLNSPSLELEVSNSSFVDNTGEREPSSGALKVELASSVHLVDCNFERNTGHTGGGVSAEFIEELVVLRSHFARNVAAMQGGGVSALGGNVYITDTSFVENQANGTCRQETACVAQMLFTPRTRCNAVPGLSTVQCSVTLADADPIKGCVSGVGGALYLGAGVSAEVHQGTFVDSQVPMVSTDEELNSLDGVPHDLPSQAGIHIYSQSHFRLTNSTFLGSENHTTVAPESRVISCLRACRGGATCDLAEGVHAPSKLCRCGGSFRPRSDGKDAYSREGCDPLRILPVAVLATSSPTTRAISTPLAELRWNWTRFETELPPTEFRIFRFNDFSSTNSTATECLALPIAGPGTTADAETVCYDYKEANPVAQVDDGDQIIDLYQVMLPIPNDTNTNHFFRISVVDDDGVGPIGDSTRDAVILCSAVSQIINTNDGGRRCEACRIGYYLNEERSCSPCREHSTTTEDGATGLQDCIAVAGYFKDTTTGEFSPCPTGSNCTQPGSTRADLAALPGWWRVDESSTVFHRCIRQDLCVGGQGAGDATCAVGHRGSFCEECLVDFAFHHELDHCRKCSPADVRTSRLRFWLVLGLLHVVAFAAICASLHFYLREKPAPAPPSGAFPTGAQVTGASRAQAANSPPNPAQPSARPNLARQSSSFSTGSAPRVLRRSNSSSRDFAATMAVNGLTAADLLYARYLKGKTRIIIGFFQVATAFISLWGSALEVDKSIEALQQVLFFFNLDIGMVITGQWPCYVDTARDHGVRLLVATIVPMSLLFVVLLSYWFMTLWKSMIARLPERELKRFRNGAANICLSIGLLLLFLVYPSVSKLVFQTFVCSELENGETYLRVDPQISCDTADYMSMRNYAFVMMILFPLLVPIVFAVPLFWYRRTLRALPPHRGHLPWAAMRPNMRGMAFLFSMYLPEFYMFEVFELWRKLLQTSVIVFLVPRSSTRSLSTFQVCMAMVFTALALSVLDRNSPYRDPTNNTFARFAQWVLFAMLALVVFAIEVPQGALEHKYFIILVVLLFVVPLAAIIHLVLQYLNVCERPTTYKVRLSTATTGSSSGSGQSWRGPPQAQINLPKGGRRQTSLDTADAAVDDRNSTDTSDNGSQAPSDSGDLAAAKTSKTTPADSPSARRQPAPSNLADVAAVAATAATAADADVDADKTDQGGTESGGPHDELADSARPRSSSTGAKAGAVSLA